MTSAVLIIPAAMRDAANAVGMAMNWGPDNYTIPLSIDGVGVTHYGCRTDVSQEFIAMLETPPPIPGVEDVIAALIVDLSETLAPWDHADAAFAAAGLVRFQP
jgi:hypothetical protein